MTTEIERGGVEVSGSHEPSYYEIALTNRQVVVAFVILLVCVVAAFLSGVWIGRESVVRSQEKLALLAHGAPAAAGDSTGGAAADKEKTEGQALQEFKFFADSHRRQGAARKPPASPPAPPPSAPEARPAGAAQSAAAPSTLADDLARRGGPSPGAVSTPPAPQAASAPAAAGPARPLQSPPREATAERAQPAADAPGEGEPPAPARRSRAAAGASASPAASGAAGEVVIQVFSTADKDQADKVRERLAGAGLTAFLSPIAKNGQTMYRVRIGPFPSRAAAEPVAEKVRKEQRLDTWITPR
jgi:cell division septation protein DedD